MLSELLGTMCGIPPDKLNHSYYYYESKTPVHSKLFMLALNGTVVSGVDEIVL